MTEGFAPPTTQYIQPLAVQTILRWYPDVLCRSPRAPRMLAGVSPELWDGHAAERLVAVIAGWARGRGAADAPAGPPQAAIPALTPPRRGP